MIELIIREAYNDKQKALEEARRIRLATLETKEQKPLENDIVIPSGRHDGRGTKLVVRYVAGRNPI